MGGTYTQSNLAIFSEKLDFGVRKRKNLVTSTRTTPQIGKLRSRIPHQDLVILVVKHRRVQNSHLHCPCAASDPPTIGPRAAATPHVLRSASESNIYVHVTDIVHSNQAIVDRTFGERYEIRDDNACEC